MVKTEIFVDFQAISQSLKNSTTGINFGPCYKAIQQLLVSSAKENFLYERSPDGIPWAPLKRPRRNSKGKDKILQDTGLLRSSISSAFKPTQGIAHATIGTFEWGTAVPYAGFHQYGTKKMVARPFIGLNDKLVKNIENVVGDYVLDLVAKGLSNP